MRGGCFSSFSNTKEIAYIVGIAATPFTEQHQPCIQENNFDPNIAAEIPKAIDAIKQNHDLDMADNTRVNASEFAHGWGGYV